MNNKKQGLDPRFAALILVLAVVASGVAILLSRKGNDQVQEAAIEAPLVDNLAESTQTSTLPSERAATSPSTNSDSAASVIATVPQLENIELPSTAAASGELETILPVGGETIAAYAMDCLSYNETTRDCASTTALTWPLRRAHRWLPPQTARFTPPMRMTAWAIPWSSATPAAIPPAIPVFKKTCA